MQSNKKRNALGQDSCNNATETYSGSAMVPQGSLSSTKNSLRYNYELNPIAPLVGSSNGSQMDNKYAFVPVSHYQTSQFSYQDPGDCNNGGGAEPMATNYRQVSSGGMPKIRGGGAGATHPTPNIVPLHTHTLKMRGTH